MFNLKAYKTAQRTRGRWSSDPPDVFLRPEFRQDPYDQSRSPGDGEGFNMVTPWSVGMSGQAPDLSSPNVSNRKGEDYPEGIASLSNPSSDQDMASYNADVPKDWDVSDDGVSGDRQGAPFGEGTPTSNGVAGHDGAVTGIGATTTRQIEDRSKSKDQPKDAKFPLGDIAMNKAQTDAFNGSRSRHPFDRIRSRQN